MQNFYPNPPTPNAQPIFDQNGNLIGYMPANQQVMNQPQQRIGTPDWWPRNQQNQRVYQQQNPQPQQSQAPAMQGKWVKTENDIVPMDIPQDGSVVVFPQTDLQVIYLKKWEGNGTITTVPYIPNVAQQPQEPTPEQQFQNSVQQRLSNVEQLLVNLTNMWQPTSTENKEEK